MEYEIVVEDGFENHFKNALMSFDKKAKIIRSKPTFIVETVTDQHEISRWTMVESIKCNEVLKEPEVEKEISTLIVGSPFSNGGWTGLGQAGVTGSNSQPYANTSGPVLFTQNVSFSSLLSQCSMCGDQSTITVTDSTTGISFALLKLVPNFNEIRLVIPMSGTPSVITIGDMRALYSSVFIGSQIMFVDGSGNPVPVKNSKLSKSIYGVTNIILEV